MFRKITSFVAAVSVLLLVQFAECQAMSFDQKAMQCCRHMPCNPANHSHDCCKKMVSSQPTIAPAIHASFPAPAAIVAAWLTVPETERVAQVSWPGIDPPQHSPPPLYIVYASLLI